MGANGLRGFIGQQVNIDVTLHWHLRSNHYPPLPLDLIEPCKQAIEAGHEEAWGRRIDMPEGLQFRGRDWATAQDIIESCHLEAFFEDEEVDDDA
jgi:hypothetical protein